MFANYIFFDDEKTRRMGLGITGAILLHALVFLWLSVPKNTEIISSDTFSAPTNVSIRFFKPIETIVPQVVEQVIPEIIPPEPIKKVVKTKPIPKEPIKKIVKKPEPKRLNNIEPAAAPQPVKKVIEHTPSPTKVEPQRIDNVIPVISEARLKGRRVQPQYPKRALRLKQQGVVLLHVLIGEDGKRQDIKMYKPSEYALLNQAALKAVKKWTFDPYVVNGRATKSWVEIPIEFRIQ